ncbi:MAG: EAL and HDOD domain-containing protein [Syntrophobacteraceae bacterium]
MVEQDVAASPCPPFFTKQPILDTKRSIWGYDLLGGEANEGLCELLLQTESVASLASSTYVGLQEAMERGKKIVVGFDAASILSGMAHALPPTSGVVRLLPGTGDTRALAAALQSLRTEGYYICMQVVPDAPLPDAVRNQADILAFDIGRGSHDPGALEILQRNGALMLARGVGTMDQFQAAKDIGFSLFQGSFFKEAEHVRDRTLASSEISRLNLLRLIEVEDPDFKALALAIRSDVAISFRLLSYLNSAYFGFRHTIQSIDQAIMLLGWNKLRSWIRAVILVDMAGKGEIPQELAELSLQRGKFFELLTETYDYWGFNPSTIFLVGLFSLLDAILGMPMDTVVELLPLEAKIKAALTRNPNNEYAPLWGLRDALEDGDWPKLDTLTRKLCLDPRLIKEFHATARDWAGGFFITGDRARG